ncbi:hypothetical protein [Streptomyces sp. WM6378]|uniref:hypothetical protein n=1 Tax=Streptomyces sp. WM6378 TaxID=1415557 RepID=UPI00131BA4DB|nr:hypothetical protein [Streptomyces sp. WM6378]
MAIVWVLAADKGTSALGTPLVRAESIIGFTQTSSTVEVLGIHPSEPVAVAAGFGNTNALIPDGFHLDLLKLFAQQTSARPARRARRHRHRRRAQLRGLLLEMAGVPTQRVRVRVPQAVTPHRTRAEAG